MVICSSNYYFLKIKEGIRITCLIFFTFNFVASCAHYKPVSYSSDNELLYPYNKANSYEQATKKEKEKFKKVVLPFLPGTQFVISQGAYGKYTHNYKGFEYAWDFEVPLGTPIVSVEDVTIIQVWQPNSGGGCDSKWSNYAHNIKVLHQDGTVAQFVHIESNLKIGALVKKGEIIATTAYNGFICNPHLHFNFFKSRAHTPEEGNPVTIPLFFKQLPEGIAYEGYSNFIKK